MKYMHAPLTEAGAIRLIDLQPCPDVNVQVQCSIIHTTLYDCDMDIIDPYTALSYVWGDPNDTVEIFVDGKELQITTNLDSALRNIRDKTRSRLIWADAICINQQDNDEKAQQVTRMGDVYKTAQNTIIYLGESTPASDAVIAYSCYLHKQRSNERSSTFNSPMFASAELRGLLERPWFTRVWIFQELLLSRNPWIQCGRSRTRWDALSNAVASFPAELLANPQTKQCLENFTGMDKSRKVFSLTDHEKPLSLPDFVNALMNTLVMRRGLGVSDPKDLLFAHLGTVGEVTRKENIHLISVDYNKTTKEVFENLVMYIICFNSGNDNLFSYAESDVDLDQRCNGLSSWCPDWTSPGLPREQNILRHALYHADRPRNGYSDDLSVNFSSDFHEKNFLSRWTNFLKELMKTTIPPILPCFGRHFGYIKKISERITLNEVISNLLRKTSDSKYDVQWDSVLSFAHRWEEFLAPAKIHLNIEARAAYLKASIRWRDTEDSFHQLRDSEFLADHILLHAVVTSGDISDDLYLPFLCGRRFAELDNKGIALVPAAAKVGDKVCRLFGSVLPFVVRPVNINTETMDIDLEIINLFDQEITHSTSWHIGHYRFVGEALVDERIFTFRAWMEYTGDTGPPALFVLH